MSKGKLIILVINSALNKKLVKLKTYQSKLQLIKYNFNKNILRIVFEI